MTQEKKTVFPKRNAIISIQLWKDKDGVDNIGVTTQENNKKWLSFNAPVFGEYLATNPLLEDFDKRFLADIFWSYLQEYGYIDRDLLKK